MSWWSYLVFSSHGFHKISYELDLHDGIDLNVELESPVLSHGKAVGKVHLNWRKNDYKLFLSSYREHLVSGSLRFDTKGFFASTNLESDILPYRKFNLNAMSQITGDGFKSSASCEVMGTEHQLDLLLSTESGTFNLNVSSSLLARNPLSLIIKGSK